MTQPPSLQYASQLAAAKRAQEREALIADIRWLLPDHPPEVIAVRVGSTPAAITRRLQRWGHGDLAAPFDRARRQQQRAGSL